MFPLFNLCSYQSIYFIWSIYSVPNLLSHGSFFLTFLHLCICKDCLIQPARCLSTHLRPLIPFKDLEELFFVGLGIFPVFTFLFPLSSNYLSLHFIVKFLEICCLPFPFYLCSTSLLMSPIFALCTLRQVTVYLWFWPDQVPGHFTRIQTHHSSVSSLEEWLTLMPYACWSALSSVLQQIYWLPTLCWALET